MPLDPSIILGVKPGNFTSPQEMYAQKMQLDQNELANRLGGLKIKEFEQGQADQNQLRQISSQFGADTSANTNALYKAGLLKEAGAYAKSQTDQQKAVADVDETKLKAAKTRFEMIGQGLGYLKDNPTMENAQSLIQGWVQSGLMPPEVAQQKMADFQKDPTQQGIQRLATMGYQGAIEAAKQLPTFQTRNTGGTTDTLSINPVTGKVMVANSVQNTQSPDNKASVGASYANAAATRSVAQATRDAASINAGYGREQDLRKEFQALPEVKNYKQAIPAFKGIEDAIKRNTPQSDINIVYGIAKLYDPNSVVREGEYATVANSPNVPDRIKGYANYLAGGGKLTQKVKDEIFAEAKSRMQSFEGEYQGARSDFESIASRSGSDPTRIFPRPDTPVVKSKDQVAAAIPQGWKVQAR